ncbi:MAG: nucleotidyltransferase domain-containing protein [Planctomycetaceae bacterium]|jgi:predicted nucleotidyltransferase|nr:nucleotidyltransferase domain-containing protein [Planctomycetaceae bacterium]
MEIDSILDDLILCLKVSGPYKIILFGSHANNSATNDSDIDLMVILDNNNNNNNNNVAKSYKERMDKKLYIRKNNL